jgi:hypothetical protein
VVWTYELHTQSSPHVFRLKPSFVGSTVKQLNISKSLEAPKNSLVEAHFVRLNFKKKQFTNFHHVGCLKSHHGYFLGTSEMRGDVVPGFSRPTLHHGEASPCRDAQSFEGPAGDLSRALKS